MTAHTPVRARIIRWWLSYGKPPHDSVPETVIFGSRPGGDQNLSSPSVVCLRHPLRSCSTSAACGRARNSPVFPSNGSFPVSLHGFLTPVAFRFLMAVGSFFFFPSRGVHPPRSLSVPMWSCDPHATGPGACFSEIRARDPLKTVVLAYIKLQVHKSELAKLQNSRHRGKNPNPRC